MIKEINAILHFIKNSDNFLITTHINADGDAYASILAMAYFMEQLGKKYEVIIDDENLDPKYNFMWGFEKISSYQDDMKSDFNAAVILDVPSSKRTGKPARLFPAPEFCVKIDHHPQEEDFAAFNIVRPDSSSTSQLIFEVISHSRIEMTDELANLLFSGIMYDTGRFSFSNTSRRDFQIAASLLRYNVKPFKISNYLFFNNSLNSMKTIGYGLAHLQAYLDGRLAVIMLPLEAMQNNNHSEIEELANYSVSIRDVEVGVFIREAKPKYYKVSFRSKGRINVNAIARAFGGGGHLHAAGCRYVGKFEDLKKKLLEEVAKNL